MSLQLCRWILPPITCLWCIAVGLCSSPGFVLGDEAQQDEQVAERQDGQTEQAEQAEQEEQEEQADDEPGQAAMEKWRTEFSAFQAMIGQLNAASREEQRALLQQVQAKRDELQTLRKQVEPQLIQAARDAAQLSEPLRATLLQLSQIALSEDDYHRAYGLLKLLVQAGSEDAAVYQYAAMAAFGSDHFQAAQELIDHIKQGGGRLQIDFLRRIEAGLGERLADWNRELEIRAAEAETDTLPRVKLETTAGDMVIELYEDQAPNTVANFVSLVEKGYYDNLSFHRVLPQFMAQGGCPDGTGMGGPGYAIPCECDRDDYRRHFSGTLSMAHAGQDTGGSQFFLTFLATSNLDGRHTVFGRIIEGMDTLAAIEKIDPEVPNPAMRPSRITKATVLRKRDHDYQPQTLPARR